MKELEAKIKSMEHESLMNYNLEQAIKLAINSIYGAFANDYFHFRSTDIAETVTLQGQDAIKHTEVNVEKYFKEFWHKDKKLHEAMGITSEVKPLTQNVWKYTDTDSGYIIFEEVMESCDWQGTVMDFILKINKHRLADYIKMVLSKYAESYNSDNFLDFELETIAHNAIWVAKKKYVQNIIWKDGKTFDAGSYISTKGLEIIQSSTPAFCRDKLTDLVKFLFSKDKLDNDAIGGLTRVLKGIKKEFQLADIEQISSNRRIGDYNKFVVNDTNEFELAKGCPIHVRAGAHHNYLVNNSKQKNDFEMIKTSDKIRWYYASDQFCDVFGYLPGNYPYQLAPKIDMDRQFEMFILEPLNRIIVPSGMPRLNRSLAYTISLF
jgi:DNA polymerase elongation subunit (family B)